MEKYFKAMTDDMESMYGGTRTKWEIGRWYTNKGDSRCHRNGFHCAENPMDCVRVYKSLEGTRFFEVEIAGNIDDEGNEVSASRIRLKRELTPEELIVEMLRYAIRHPKDERLKNGKDATGHFAIVMSDTPVIAVSETPMFVGMIKTEDGRVARARAFRFDEPGVYTMEDEDETESD